MGNPGFLGHIWILRDTWCFQVFPGVAHHEEKKRQQPAEPCPDASCCTTNKQGAFETIYNKLRGPIPVGLFLGKLANPANPIHGHLQRCGFRSTRFFWSPGNEKKSRRRMEGLRANIDELVSCFSERSFGICAILQRVGLFDGWVVCGHC